MNLFKILNQFRKEPFNIYKIFKKTFYYTINVDDSAFFIQTIDFILINNNEKINQNSRLKRQKIKITICATIGIEFSIKRLIKF